MGLLAFSIYHVHSQTNSQNCGRTKEFQSLRELTQEPQNVLASNFGFCRLTNTSGAAGILLFYNLVYCKIILHQDYNNSYQIKYT